MAHLQGLRYRLVDEPLAVLAAAGFDIEPAWKTVRSMLEEFWATLPRLIAACIVVALPRCNSALVRGSFTVSAQARKSAEDRWAMRCRFAVLA